MTLEGAETAFSLSGLIDDDAANLFSNRRIVRYLARTRTSGACARRYNRTHGSRQTRGYAPQCRNPSSAGTTKLSFLRESYFHLYGKKGRESRFSIENGWSRQRGRLRVSKSEAITTSMFNRRATSNVESSTGFRPTLAAASGQVQCVVQTKRCTPRASARREFCRYLFPPVT